MVSPYPGGFDSFIPKIDHVDKVMAAHVNELQDGIEAIEPTLGLNPQGTSPDVTTRLTNAMSSDGNQINSRTLFLNSGYVGGNGITTTVTGDLSMNGDLIVDGTITATGGIALSGTSSQYWRVDNTDASLTTEDFQFGIAGRFLRWNKVTSRFEFSGPVYLPTLLEISSGTGTNALAIDSTTTTNNSNGLYILKTGAIVGNSYGLYSSVAGGTVYNGAVYGTSTGVGTSTIGVSGASAGSATNSIGVYGYSNAIGTSAYGGSFEVAGAATTNYAIYGTASGAGTNWAGYFNAGNVRIINNTHIGTTATPTNGYLNVVDTVGSVTSAIAGQANVNNHTGVSGAAIGVGGSANVGVSGTASGSTAWNEGVVGSIGAETATNNIGIYGTVVSIGANNFAGYFTTTGAGTINYGTYALSENAASNYSGYFRSRLTTAGGTNYGVYSYSSGVTGFDIATVAFYGVVDGDSASSTAVIGQSNSTGTDSWAGSFRNDGITTNTATGCYARSIGAGVTNYGMQGISQNATTNYAGYFSVPAGGTPTTSYGIYSSSAAVSTTGYGIYTESTGAGTINYGIYSTSSGATTNYSGYFSGLLYVTGTNILTGTSLNLSSTTASSVALSVAKTNAVVGSTYGISCSAVNGSVETDGIYSSADSNGVTSNGVYGAVAGASATSVGVRGLNTATGTTGFGIYGLSSGAATSGYGGYFNSTGAGTTNYGIYATSSGATTNYAGYFSGRLYIIDSLNTYCTQITSTSTTASTIALDVLKGGVITGSTTALQSTCSGATVDNTAIYGVVTGTGTTSYGVNTSVSGSATTAYGVRGISSTTGTNSYGIYGATSGVATTNYAVYGDASGATTNWAGYFNSGNFYIANQLKVGLTTADTLTKIRVLDGSTFHVPTENTTLFIESNLIDSGAGVLNGISVWSVNGGLAATTVHGIASRAVGAFAADVLTGVYAIVDNNTFATTTATGVFGSSLTAAGVDNRGVEGTAGSATTNYAGRFTIGAGGTPTTSYGIYGTSTGATTNYAGYFAASGAHTTNYGIYSSAGGATTNYSGYFSGPIYGVHSSASNNVRTLEISSTNTTTTGNTAYSFYNSLISSAIVTGTSQDLYGSYNSVTKTGADTSVNTTSLYGVYGITSNTGSTNVGVKNTYGGYFSATGDTAGTSTTYGVYATATGADTNWAGYFNGNVNITGALSVVGPVTGSGAVPIGAVVPVFISLAGAESDATLMSHGFAKCDGTTPASQGVVDPVIVVAMPNVNAGAFVRGSTTSWTTGGASGGADSVTIASTNLPVHVHSIDHGHANTFAVSAVALGGTTTFASSAHTHTTTHGHGVGTLQFATCEFESGTLYFYSSGGAGRSADILSETIQSGSGATVSDSPLNVTPATRRYTDYGSGTTADDSTASGAPSATATVTVSGGVLSGAVTDYSGSSGNGGFANTAIATLPVYFNAVYYMRVK